MFKAYVCDPEKNKGCRKTGCQTDCFLTLNPEYAKALRAMTNKEMLKYIKHKLNDRKMSIPISETYTEDHKVGWKDGIFWSDVLEIFEELEGEK